MSPSLDKQSHRWTRGRAWLLTTGLLDLGAAALHVGCILGGASWFRFFGAGEVVAQRVSQGDPIPLFFTAVISGALAICAISAFSAGGFIRPFPFRSPILILITIVYVLRALAYPWLLVAMADRTWMFLTTSSAIVAVLAFVHVMGLVALSQRSQSSRV